MRVLLRNIRLSGGAPQSMLQYVKVLHAGKHQLKVIAQLEEKEIERQYRQFSNDLQELDDIQGVFDQKMYLQLYHQLKAEYRILKQYRPDLVLALGEVNGYFYGAFCESLNIPIITFLAGGDLTWQSFRFSAVKCHHYICFSKENEELLVKCRHNAADHIHVISNRIMLKGEYNDLAQHYSIAKDDSIHILITSRISSGKIDSVKYFLENLQKVAVDADFHIEVRIAGTGNKMDMLNSMIDQIQQKNLHVTALGHVDNLLEHFEWAHIAVGKGRSVLEPMMMNRVGCVIGDRGDLEIPDAHNLERLYHYNFAGRHLVCDDPCAAMRKLLIAVYNGYDTDAICNVAKQIRQLYSAEYLPEKFLGVVNEMEPSNRPEKKANIAWLLFRFCYQHLKKKLLG